ncbi:MAG: SDR family oxidoreductase, partial [Promethearchaeota archaeon]
CSEIKGAGGIYFAVAADLTDENQVKDAIDQVFNELGRVDVLVNNAGVGIFKRVDQFSVDDFQYLFKVNVFGMFYCTREVVPFMIRRKQGHIINISSVAGLVGIQGGTGYSATKFAVVGFTEALREDLKHYGIAVTVICPGSVNTTFGGKYPSEKQGKPFLLDPDDVARVVEYLVSESEIANTKLIELEPRKRKEYRN